MVYNFPLQNGGKILENPANFKLTQRIKYLELSAQILQGDSYELSPSLSVFLRPLEHFRKTR